MASGTSRFRFRAAGTGWRSAPISARTAASICWSAISAAFWAFAAACAVSTSPTKAWRPNRAAGNALRCNMTILRASRSGGRSGHPPDHGLGRQFRHVPTHRNWSNTGSRNEPWQDHRGAGCRHRRRAGGTAYRRLHGCCWRNEGRSSIPATPAWPTARPAADAARRVVPLCVGLQTLHHGRGAAADGSGPAFARRGSGDALAARVHPRMPDGSQPQITVDQLMSHLAGLDTVQPAAGRQPMRAPASRTGSAIPASAGREPAPHRQRAAGPGARHALALFGGDRRSGRGDRGPSPTCPYQEAMARLVTGPWGSRPPSAPRPRAAVGELCRCPARAAPDARPDPCVENPLTPGQIFPSAARIFDPRRSPRAGRHGGHCRNRADPAGNPARGQLPQRQAIRAAAIEPHRRPAPPDARSGWGHAWAGAVRPIPGGPDDSAARVVSAGAASTGITGSSIPVRAPLCAGRADQYRGRGDERRLRRRIAHAMAG